MPRWREATIIVTSVDHSAFIYLMGPKGNFLEVFGFRTSPEKMAEKIKEAMKRERS